MNSQLSNLPWETLLTLASGYAGYFVAHLGVRDHHKTIDVTFGTLVFGFFAAFAYELADRLVGLDILTASVLAFAASVAIGGLWSRFGRHWMRAVLRKTKVSHSDDLPSAWVSIFPHSNLATFQLSVKLKDGTWLKSDDLRKFEYSPNGPCVLGGTGDILMYVTHQKGPQDADFEQVEGVQDPEWGEEITYVPRDNIARVDIRRRRG